MPRACRLGTQEASQASAEPAHHPWHAPSHVGPSILELYDTEAKCSPVTSLGPLLKTPGHSVSLLEPEPRAQGCIGEFPSGMLGASISSASDGLGRCIYHSCPASAGAGDGRLGDLRQAWWGRGWSCALGFTGLGAELRSGSSWPCLGSGQCRNWIIIRWQ